LEESIMGLQIRSLHLKTHRKSHDVYVDFSLHIEGNKALREERSCYSRFIVSTLMSMSSRIVKLHQ